MGNKNTLCVLPWNSVMIGVVFGKTILSVCCNSYEGSIKTDDGQHASTADLAQINELRFVKDLRQDLFDGVKNNYCNRCWNMEPDSFRSVSNIAFPTTISKLVASPHVNACSQGIEYLTLNIGNKCNMACRMCNPLNSSLLEKEWILDQVPSSLNIHDIKTVTSSESMLLSDPDLLNFIKLHAATLRSIYIFGGEPLIIQKSHCDFLQLLIDLGVSKNISLKYSTNGSTTNIDKFVPLWEQFKIIFMQVSVDGFRETYEYIRWPLDWNKIDANLKIFKELHDKRIINASIGTTVQALTITSVDNLLNYLDQTYNFECHLIPVDQPEVMSLSIVPKDVLRQTLDEWKYGPLKAVVESIINPYLEKDDTAPLEKFNEFVAAMHWQDKFRKQDLFTTHPYMKQWHI